MRVSEILRQLADLVDQTEDVAVQDAGMEPGAEAGECPMAQDGAETGAGEITITQLEPVTVDGEDQSEPETMVSPLQQEHELLKKSQDVDNHVDEFADANAKAEAFGDTQDNVEMDGGPQDEVEENALTDRYYGGADEDEWTSAMGHDQDDPEERIGQPDDEDEVYEDELARMKQIAGIGEEAQGPVDHAENCRPVSINPRAEAARQFHRNRNS